MKKKRKKQKKARQKNQKQKIDKHSTEAFGIITLAFAVVLLLSLFSYASHPASNNWLGVIGYSVGKLSHAVLGLSSYFVVIFLIWTGWRLFISKKINHLLLKCCYFFLFILSTSVLLSLVEDHFPNVTDNIRRVLYSRLWQSGYLYHIGGAPFFYLYHDMPLFNLKYILNGIGIAIIFSGTMIGSLLTLLKIKPESIFLRIYTFFIGTLKWLFSRRNRAINDDPQYKEKRFVKLRNPFWMNTNKSNVADNTDLLAIHPKRDIYERPSLSKKSQTNQQRKTTIANPNPATHNMPIKEHEIKFAPAPKYTANTQKKNKQSHAPLNKQIVDGEYSNYTLPPSSLLSSPQKADHTRLKKDLKKQAEVLEETLLSFGIEAKVGQINCGPTINSFEVHPAIGVKVQKIKTLENDIALNMEAKSIRIIAPIPGKAAIGIEIPNPHPQEVSFKDLLHKYKYSQKSFHIPLLLGKSVSGEHVLSDLAKMPHCIIAGATGSGKSVCINTLVMSILMIAKPDEIKLLMVDPKKVELTPYSKLPHMLAPVITEPSGALSALQWLVKEMESRYEILKLMGFRNITSFNHRQIDLEHEASLDREIPKRLPFIVAIIDEFADLMMVATNEIESPIARIAQMARAVGIHLILATQRPSREVITGLIKANFPTRISFKVSSRINSQIILDEVGAETLLGNGDMLFLPPGSSHLTRAQGAYIRDEDIHRVIQFISGQAPPNYTIHSFDLLSGLDDDHDESKQEPKDTLYQDAYNIVMESQNASTTFLQRKLKIGYARAASLMDELEQKGVVGPSSGSKPRAVLISNNNESDDDKSY